MTNPTSSTELYEALRAVIPNLPDLKKVGVRGLILKLAPMDAPTITIEMFPRDLGDPSARNVITQFAIVTEDEYHLLQSIPTTEETP